MLWHQFVPSSTKICTLKTDQQNALYLHDYHSPASLFNSKTRKTIVFLHHAGAFCFFFVATATHFLSMRATDFDASKKTQATQKTNEKVAHESAPAAIKSPNSKLQPSAAWLCSLCTLVYVTSGKSSASCWKKTTSSGSACGAIVCIVKETAVLWSTFGGSGRDREGARGAQGECICISSLVSAGWLI